MIVNLITMLLSKYHLRRKTEAYRKEILVKFKEALLLDYRYFCLDVSDFDFGYEHFEEILSTFFHQFRIHIVLIGGSYVKVSWEKL